MDNFEEVSLFEDRFWLQILGDHSRFIFTSLSPDETEAVNQAQNFIMTFDSLLQQSRLAKTAPELMALNRQAAENACAIMNFKLELLRRHLVGQVKVHLPPTFFNHMLNELQDYLSSLQCLQGQQVPPAPHPLQLHLLWLPDAAGHAASIAANLDETEADLLKQAKAFKKLFQSLFIKAHEMYGYLRTGLRQFPALDRLNTQAQNSILLFNEFLEELKVLVQTKRVLSTLLPLIPDHMQREGCYYLTKLSQVADIESPNCDPTKPRVEG